MFRADVCLRRIGAPPGALPRAGVDLAAVARLTIHPFSRPRFIAQYDVIVCAQLHSMRNTAMRLSLQQGAAQRFLAQGVGGAVLVTVAELLRDGDGQVVIETFTCGSMREKSCWGIIHGSPNRRCQTISITYPI